MLKYINGEYKVKRVYSERVANTMHMLQSLSGLWVKDSSVKLAAICNYARTYIWIYKGRCAIWWTKPKVFQVVKQDTTLKQI